LSDPVLYQHVEVSGEKPLGFANRVAPIRLNFNAF
jgi:hypothetical protein